MDGSGCAYAVRAALWTFLMLLTLGLILPWRAAALERYKMRHCYYGDLQGSFEGRGLDFLKRGWWLWLLAALLVIGPRSLIDIMVVAEKPLSDSTAQSISSSRFWFYWQRRLFTACSKRWNGVGGFRESVSVTYGFCCAARWSASTGR
jgi:hypothetical protein